MKRIVLTGLILAGLVLGGCQPPGPRKTNRVPLQRQGGQGMTEPLAAPSPLQKQLPREFQALKNRNVLENSTVSANKVIENMSYFQQQQQKIPSVPGFTRETSNYNVIAVARPGEPVGYRMETWSSQGKTVVLIYRLYPTKEAAQRAFAGLAQKAAPLPGSEKKLLKNADELTGLKDRMVIVSQGAAQDLQQKLLESLLRID